MLATIAIIVFVVLTIIFMVWTYDEAAFKAEKRLAFLVSVISAIVVTWWGVFLASLIFHV